jgi:hypothetical protein
MFDSVEPETRKFLKNILKSIMFFLAWMFFNVMVGIFMEYGLIENGVSFKNVLFYSLSLFFLIAYLMYIKKVWKKQSFSRN